EKAPKPKPAVKKPEEKPAAPAAPPKPGEVEVFVNEAHAGLVDLGLTVAPTKGVFAKRVATYPGGEAAFVAEYRSAPYKAVTRVLADWLGFRVPEAFELDAILKEVNPRLSSFKLTLAAKDSTWLDQELNLRKVKLFFAALTGEAGNRKADYVRFPSSRLHVSNREVCGCAVLSGVWHSAARSSSRTVVLPGDFFPGCHRASFRVPADIGPNILVTLMMSTTILPPSWGRHSHGSEECRREDPTVQSGRGVCMSAGSLDGVANAVSRRSWSRVVAFILVFVMVASALAIVMTPARASSRPRIGLPEAIPDYMKFIVVNNFRFDPLAAMTSMPTSLQYNSVPRK